MTTPGPLIEQDAVVDVPVIDHREYRAILRSVKHDGEVPVRWEALTAAVAIGFTLGGWWLLTVASGLAIALATFSFGCGMLLWQILQHECAHRSLLRGRRLNDLCGWWIGLWVLMPYPSFRRGHHAHHAELGTLDDPTAAPQQRLPLQQVVTCLVRLHVIPVLYLGGVYGPYLLYDLRRLSQRTLGQKVVCLFNLSAIAAAHLTLAWLTGPAAYIVAVGGGFWVAAILYEYLFTQNQHLGLRPVPLHQEHYSYREQHGFTRSVELPLAGLLLFFNLHKEHHLYPQLPARYLPRVHRWLQQHRPELLAFTSSQVGPFSRRRELRLDSPTAGDHAA